MFTLILEGFGKFDGKYFMDKVFHLLDKGYIMELELHKVLEYSKTWTSATNGSDNGHPGMIMLDDFKMWRIKRIPQLSGWRHPILKRMKK